MKYNIVTEYWNKELKIWQSEKDTPYLKKTS